MGRKSNTSLTITEGHIGLSVSHQGSAAHQRRLQHSTADRARLTIPNAARYRELWAVVTLEYPQIYSTDLDDLRLLAEWHEV
jgi:hypothetical protein